MWMEWLDMKDNNEIKFVNENNAYIQVTDKEASPWTMEQNYF